MSIASQLLNVGAIDAAAAFAGCSARVGERRERTPSIGRYVDSSLIWAFCAGSLSLNRLRTHAPSLFFSLSLSLSLTSQCSGVVVVLTSRLREISVGSGRGSVQVDQRQHHHHHHHSLNRRSS